MRITRTSLALLSALVLSSTTLVAQGTGTSGAPTIVDRFTFVAPSAPDSTECLKTFWALDLSQPVLLQPAPLACAGPGAVQRHGPLARHAAVARHCFCLQPMSGSTVKRRRSSCAVMASTSSRDMPMSRNR